MYRISILNRIYNRILRIFSHYASCKLTNVLNYCTLVLYTVVQDAQSGKWGPARHRRAHNAHTQAQWMAEIK